MDVMDLGDEEFDEEDKYLLEINLGDLDTTLGERQSYWLLAVEAALESRRLRIADQSGDVETPRRRA